MLPKPPTAVVPSAVVYNVRLAAVVVAPPVAAAPAIASPAVAPTPALTAVSVTVLTNIPLAVSVKPNAAAASSGLIPTTSLLISPAIFITSSAVFHTIISPMLTPFC